MRQRLRELWDYREVLLNLVRKELKVKYIGSVLGAVWSLLNPVVFLAVFTFVAKVLGASVDDYPVFLLSGLLAWNLFAVSLSTGAQSVVANANLVKKVYFPRIFLPLASVGALLVDLAFSLLLQAVLMLKYHWHLTTSVLLLPVFIFGTVMSAAGLGMILSAVNVRFRDVKYVVPFMIQMGIFLTPVIYPVRYIPQKWMLLMGLNPMAGMVIGFRHALLGSQAPWSVIGLSFAVSISMFFFGLYFFRRMERHFADVI